VARNGNDRARTNADEAARYREAAELTLKQIDWCVSYFRRIRKDRIANAIENNAASIRGEMHRAE
jgi:hypothetical protein